jgi:hypothetical protein
MLHPAVLLTALTLAGAPEADEPFRIAVPAMRLSGVGEDLGRILTEIVTTETSSLPNAKVIGASDITTMLGFEQEKQLLGCEDNVSCIAEIGGALGVELLLVSDLGLVGETYVLNLKLIDTESVLVKKRVYKTVSGKADDLIEAVRKALRELLAVVAPDAVAAVEEPVESEPAPPAQPPADEPPAVDRDGPRMWLRWTAIGAGGALLGLAGFVELMAKMDYDKGLDSVKAGDYEVHRADARDRMNNADDLSRNALLIGIAGAVVTGAGITWLVMTPSQAESSTAVAPVISDDALGFAVSGTF